MSASVAATAAPTSKARSTAAEPQARPRIGLVLSGGGARGGAHLGVLKVLEELQIPVDVIVGTSAGAIIGAAYASGMTLSEIEDQIRPLHTALLVRDVDRLDLPVRRKADDAHNYLGPEIGINAHGLALPKGAVAGVSLEAVLRRLTVRQRDPNFDALPIPFRAIATDLTSAEMVVLHQGSLATAIRASMALPALVNPVEIDGRLLVDGGISRNLPVDIARSMGAEVIIAINIGTPLQDRAELTSVLSISDQMVRILTAKNVSQSLEDLKPEDVLITPELGNVGTADFDRLFEAAAAGEQAVRAAAETLQRYRVLPSVYAAYQQQRAIAQQEAVVVDEVRIKGLERVNPQTVRSALRTRVGKPFDPAVADSDMKRLYSSGDFEHVSYYLDAQPDGSHIFTANATEKSWGPHYLRFGLELSSDFEGNSYFSTLLTHRRPWLNSLGGEWRNDLQIGHIDRLRTEWYQPLNTRQQLFLATQAQVARQPFDLFLNGQRAARYRREDASLGLDAGLAFGAASELRTGLVRGRVRLATDTGLIPGALLMPSTNVAGILTQFQFDTLDSLHFPRKGAALDVRYFRSQPALGAEQSYGKAQFSAQAATSRGAHSLRAAAFGTRAVGSGELPDYELAQLGGFLRLSGYRTNEFLGTGVSLGRVVYAYRVSAPGLLEGVHLGVSAEAGRVTHAVGTGADQSTLHSNALFLAVDTPIGPVYLGYGHAGSGRNATYFYLGLP